MSSTCGLQPSSCARALAERGEPLDREQALVDARELRADVEVHACDVEAERRAPRRSTRSAASAASPNFELLVRRRGSTRA